MVSDEVLKPMRGLMTIVFVEGSEVTVLGRSEGTAHRSAAWLRWKANPIRSGRDRQL